ncbi:hypothetical protein ACWDBW_44810 [Streptomyces sp. NPDC001107]
MASGAAAVGFGLAARSRAVTGSGRHLAEIPAPDGTLVMDETSLAAASDDCGHIVHRRPAAVRRQEATIARLPAAETGAVHVRVGNPWVVTRDA